jgi:hypothetical protein
LRLGRMPRSTCWSPTIRATAAARSPAAMSMRRSVSIIRRLAQNAPNRGGHGGLHQGPVGVRAHPPYRAWHHQLENRNASRSCTGSRIDRLGRQGRASVPPRSHRKTQFESRRERGARGARLSEPRWHGDVRCRIYVDAAEVRLEASGALCAMGYVPYMARKDDELATLEIDQPVPAVA